MSDPSRVLNESSIPSSPPKITPVVVAALRTLLCGGYSAEDLCQLLLLEQDVDFTGLSFKRGFVSLSDYVPFPYSMLLKAESFSATVNEVNHRFVGDISPDFAKRRREREFLDPEWCQDYLDALFEIDNDYMLAVLAFTRLMRFYGTGEWNDYGSPERDIPSWGRSYPPRTLNELTVIRVAEALMEKPQWEIKVDNEEIVEKWKSEAAELGLDPIVVDTAIERVRWLRKTHDSLTGSRVTQIRGVCISDSLMDDNDLSALKDIAALLEDVPDKLKDWHPGSDGQVLDLLHPSLYPYVRGRTPRYVPELNLELADDASKIERLSFGIIKGCGTGPIRHTYMSPEAALASFGEGSPTTDDSARKDTIELTWPREQAYQWLPTDVSLSTSITEPVVLPTVRFLSYINNLHARSSTGKERVYPILERLFSKFIPMFERTVYRREEDRPWPAFPEPHYSDSGSEDEFEDNGGDENNSKGEGNAEGEEEEHEQLEYKGIKEGGGVEGDKTEGEQGQNMTAEDGADEQRNYSPPNVMYTRTDTYKVKRVTIEEISEEEEPHIGTYKFKNSDQLQVIIKLANIHLTPDKPDYPGGSWHVEGTDTERICATGIYYYDSENITTSKLSFRVSVSVSSGTDYNQDRFGRLGRKYGIYQNAPANQFLGSVVAQQGRCICFPNDMQHRVEPFSLLDRTRPGHRKILAFFLVNPHKRVLSTSDVPPQQFEWFASELRKGESRLAILPQEVFDLIMEHASAVAAEEGYPWPMSWEEALKHRELLMAERGRFATYANGVEYEREFDLCEH